MQKAARRYVLMLALPGLCLLTAFFLNTGVEFLPGAQPAQAVHAAGTGGGGPAGPPERQKCTGAHNKPFFGSAVVIGSGEVICSDVTSFGGTVVVRGKVRGDVVSFDGNVVIDGNVDGNIILYGGNVTLQNDAHVNGDIHLCGGQWISGADAQLHGTVFDCPTSMGQLFFGDAGPSFHFWSVLMWVALGLLLTSFLPEHVMLVRTTVLSKGRRSLALGLLSVLLIPAVLAILLALIISIPLAIILILGFIAAWALGTVAVGWLIGEHILRRLAPHQNTRPMQVVVGLTVLVLAGSLPYIGWLVSIGAGLVGLGAVFLSRFGTRLYAQPKQPIML